MPSVKICPGIINPSDIFTKEMKDNTHFRNLRDSIMVSLQALLKYSHNVTTHIISTNKLLFYYSTQSEQIVTDSLDLKTGVPEHNVPKMIELQLGVRQSYKRSSLHFSQQGGVDGNQVNKY